MLHANITLKEIHYEKSFANLFPVGMQKCREILSALNGLLQKDELGRNICIGNIYMAQDSEGQMSLIGRNIKVDYSGLMKNETMKQKIGNLDMKCILQLGSLDFEEYNKENFLK